MNSSANTMTMQIVAPEAQRAGRNHVKAPVDLLPGSSASSLQMEMELWLSLAESINDGDALQHSSRVGLLASRLG